MLMGGNSNPVPSFQTTIAAFVDSHDITLTAAPTQATNNVSLITALAVAAPGTGVAPGDIITAGGGSLATNGVAARYPVASTQVVSATVNAGGSGGANGACTVATTTGQLTPTGAAAQFSGTVTANALGGALTQVSGGSYSINPLATAEPVVPVTGCAGLTGATINTVPGALTFGPPIVAGAYTTVPGTFTQGATTGSGTGTTATPTSVLGQAFMYGPDATTQLNAALTAAAGSQLFVPPGNYLISAPIFVSSNTDVSCAGPGATFVAEHNLQNGNGTTQPPGYAMMVNQDWNATSLTDTNIAIHNCGFTFAWFGAFTGSDAIHFMYAQNILVDHINCYGGDDCTAMQASSNTVVRNSTAAATINACWDHWMHPAYGYVFGNYCTPNGGYGILYNSVVGVGNNVGLGGDFEGNTILETPGANLIVGIWIGSLGAANAGPTAYGAIVAGNTIDGGAGNGLCIKNEGASFEVMIRANVCKNATAAGVAIEDISDSSGTPTNTQIAFNSIRGWATTGTNPEIYTNGTGTNVNNNRTSAATYAFALQLAGVAERSLDNYFAAGSSGSYKTTGATNFVIHDFLMPQLATPSSCGSSPTVATNSNINAGTITIGTGTITACTIAFVPALAAVPNCTVSANTTGLNPWISALSASAMTISTAATADSDKISYVCIQQQG